MKRLFVAMLMLPLSQGLALAQGDANAGKQLWDSPNTQCRNCHGEKGEGAYGPDLAGRKLSVAHFTQAVRKPWGIMPAFIASQVSDAELGNFVAYFDSLPAVATPGKWRFEVPANAPRGQQVALNVGCGQCHGPLLNGPRANMGAVNADLAYFKNLVYNHTTAMPQHVNNLGEPPMTLRVRMGNFSPTRVWEYQLEEIYAWTRDIGFRARLTSRWAKGDPVPNGVAYKLTVHNGALPGKGLTVEDPEIRLILPAGVDVIRAEGVGYQGVSRDEQARANVAVFKGTKLAPKEDTNITIVLSKAGTAQDNLRGNIRWSKPSVKTGNSDQAAINPAPL